MTSPFLRSHDDAQAVENEMSKAARGVLGRVRAVWMGLRDAYYSRLDELEREVCSS